MSNAITEKEQRITDRPGVNMPGAPGLGPSDVRQDEPTLPRTLGMIGAALIIFGGMALGFNLYGKSVRVSTGWATFLLAVGFAGLLFHAAFDRDVQFRRMYLAFGYFTLLLGLWWVIPTMRPERLPGWAWVPAWGLALLFFLAFLRNETELEVRNIAQLTLAGVGGLMAAVGLIGGNLRGEFLVPFGLVFALLGLVYVAAFIGTKGISNDSAYLAALVLSFVGVIVLLISLGRALFAPTGGTWFVSYGSLLLLVGMLYTAVGAGMASDSPFFVLTRRELGSFFYSPMAYLVLLGFSVLTWPCYNNFLKFLTSEQVTPIEPIVQNYLIAWFPIIALIVIVPVITMRLLSEEQRSGTLEVLLTAPVDESVIVLSKFTAALITYIIVWAPFGLYLLAIPLGGGNTFDYRPLLSFGIAMIVSGAAFVSMGLFFSSLTKNQIASFVLTCAGMLLLTYSYPSFHSGLSESWRKVLTHISYLHLWIETVEGKVAPRFLLFPLSLTALFLFLTVKVLESRKWR